jgi:hypothetical protein
VSQRRFCRWSSLDALPPALISGFCAIQSPSAPSQRFVHHLMQPSSSFHHCCQQPPPCTILNTVCYQSQACARTHAWFFVPCTTPIHLHMHHTRFQPVGFTCMCHTRLQPCNSTSLDRNPRLHMFCATADPYLQSHLLLRHTRIRPSEVLHPFAACITPDHAPFNIAHRLMVDLPTPYSDFGPFSRPTIFFFFGFWPVVGSLGFWPVVGLFWISARCRPSWISARCRPLLNFGPLSALLDFSPLLASFGFRPVVGPFWNLAYCRPF